jgi:thiol-disulfide isomerase/thioredoxin
LLLRYPKAAYESPTKLKQFINENYDTNGNLNQYLTNYWRRHNPNFEGKRGTFYYLDRSDLRRGDLNVEGTIYQIGIEDWTANGKYSDPKDRLFVDLNRDGRLTPRDTREVFKLSDTISIQNNAFQITHIDPYGRTITLSRISNYDNTFFVSFSDELKIRTNSENHFPAVISENFWEKKFISIDEDTLSMSGLKGRFVLLNFWGEWCAPCYREIPLLVRANNRYEDEQLTIQSFHYTGNLAKARDVMIDYGINWPQILLDDETAQRFRVSAYPNNILIFPDGKKAIISGGIEEGFFTYYTE